MFAILGCTMLFYVMLSIFFTFPNDTLEWWDPLFFSQINPPPLVCDGKSTESGYGQKWRATSKRLHSLTRLWIFMSVIVLTCFEYYFWASVSPAEVEHHREIPACQHIWCRSQRSWCFLTLRDLQQNSFCFSKFWKLEGFFFLVSCFFLLYFVFRENGDSFPVWNTQNWQTSRAHTFQPNLKGVKHFQMAAGNYCSVCISCFSLSPTNPSWPKKSVSFSFFTFFFTKTDCFVGQFGKHQPLMLVAVQILQTVPVWNHLEGKKPH